MTVTINTVDGKSTRLEVENTDIAFKQLNEHPFPWRIIIREKPLSHYIFTANIATVTVSE